MTVTLQIGNSDDKLTQKEWSKFIEAFWMDVMRTSGSIEHYDVHFCGFSSPASPYQNACIVLDVPEERMAELRAAVTRVRKIHRQDSVALTCGETEMI